MQPTMCLLGALCGKLLAKLAWASKLALRLLCELTLDHPLPRLLAVQDKAWRTVLLWCMRCMEKAVMSACDAACLVTLDALDLVLSLLADAQTLGGHLTLDKRF